MKKVSEIFGKIVAAVKGFFGAEFIAVKKYSTLAVNVTNKVKAVIESPIAGFVVEYLIPGNVDNEVLYKLRKVLPKVAEEMAIIHDIAQAAPTHSSMIEALMAHLADKSPEARAIFYVELAARINVAMADGKLSLTEGIMLSQLVYNEIKRK